MTAPDYQARLSDLRKDALRLDSDGDVIGFDAVAWAQADELSRALGTPEGGDLLGLMRKGGIHSAWLYYPEHVLRWRQPEAWEACCRLYAADVAERALDVVEAQPGAVDARSRAAVQAARDHAHGRITDAALRAAGAAARAAARAAAWNEPRNTVWLAAGAAAGAARSAAWDAARAAAWDAARIASFAAERRAQWQRLLQYIHHGPAAEHMPWPKETQSQETP